MTAHERLVALCARLGAVWREDLQAPRPTIVLARTDGTEIGTASGDSFDAAVRAHEIILADTLPAPRRRPIEDVPAHPALGNAVHSTKRVDVRAVGAMRDWIEAAAQDPQGRAVRLWVETEEMSNG